MHRSSWCLFCCLRLFGLHGFSAQSSAISRKGRRRCLRRRSIRQRSYQRRQRLRHERGPGVSGFPPDATDIVSGGPLSRIPGPLAENCGPSRTHALVAASLAVDAVGAGCPPSTDQRRFTRAPCMAMAMAMVCRPVKRARSSAVPRNSSR
ncbi:MAG: choice-of-anchor Q domain-containing protein [Gammaproteobacteria bacterium]